MNTFEKSFIRKIIHPDEWENIYKNNTKAYTLSKSKHKNIYVFYNKKNMIILDKRYKTINVYNTLKIAANKMII